MSVFPRAALRLRQADSWTKPFRHAELQHHIHPCRLSILSQPLSSRRTFHVIRSTTRKQRLNFARPPRPSFYSSGRPVIETAQEKAKEKTLSASQRFKELSRKYGWAAVGVYFGLSVLDFPFCFLAVRMLGPERVGEAEHYIVNGFWNIVGRVIPSMKPETKENTMTEPESALSEMGHDIATGATAVTPKVVKFLRARGWKIGNPKAV